MLLVTAVRLDDLTLFCGGLARLAGGSTTTTNGAGVDLHAPDSSGKTALHNAAAGGHRDAAPWQTLYGSGFKGP